MQKQRSIVFWIATAVAVIVGVNSQYGACPYAKLQDGYHSLVLPSHHSAQQASYSNSIPDHNGQYSPAHTFSSLVHKYLAYEDIGLPYTSSNPLISNNVISNLYIDPPKCAVPPETCANDTTHYYYRSLDGSCNNLNNPGWGMARTTYGRLLPPNYAGNDYTTTSKNGAPLPTARSLSLSVFGEDYLQDEFRTLASMQWGQIAAHDISKLSLEGAPDNCCDDLHNARCLPIHLHPQGPIALSSGKYCLPFVRALTDKDANCQKDPYHAEKITTVSAFLDMSSIYGNSKKQNEKIRQYTGGLLQTSFINNRQWLPIIDNDDSNVCGKNNYKCYNIPDSRNQFIPSIIVMQTILVREHNRIACALSQLNPFYSDEQLYQLARKISIAQYQNIIYYEWLPVVLGPKYVYANGLSYYSQNGEFVNDYNHNEDPAPLAESATAALRYCHTQVPGHFTLVSPSRVINETMRLSDYFVKPENIDFLSFGENFDYMIRGLLTQLQKHPDPNVNREIKHYFNRKPNEEYGGDLKAIDINRGRDYGLPSYNDLRQYCGLPRAYEWAEFRGEIPLEKIEILQQFYRSPEDVEINVGGALEYHLPESLFGPTFQCILGKQFRRSRISDRFFYENENSLSGFTAEQLAEIRKSSLAGLFCNNGDYLQYIQPNAFIVPNPNNVERSCDLIPRVDLSKWTANQQQAYYT